MKRLRSQVACVNGRQPKTWDDYRRGCISTFRAGYEGKEAAAFCNGMHTVFDLLEGEFPPAEQCQATLELLEACKAARRFCAADAVMTAGEILNCLDTAIAKAEGTDATT